MTTAAIGRERLGRASRQELTATRSWAPRIAASPTVTTASIPGLGLLSVRLARLVATPPRIPEGRGGPVWLAGAAGQSFQAIAFDGATAASLCALIVGAPQPAVARSISPLERGLLSAAAIPVLAAVGLPGALVLDEHGMQPPIEHPALELALSWPGGHGRAWIVSRSADAPALTSERGADALGWLHRSLTLTATCELARAVLPLNEWSDLDVGDAIVFPCSAADRSAGAAVWAATVRFGGLAASATLDEQGDVRLVGAPVSDPSHPPRPGATSVPDASSSSPPSGAANAAELLASATIELVAEVGRATLKGQELAGLLEGAVLGLGVRADELVVTLTSGGRPVARGTLVDVEGELGVRIVARLG